MMATRAPKHSLLLAASVVAAAAAAARATASTSSSGGASYADLYESGVVTAYTRAVLFGVVWALSLYVVYLVHKRPAPKETPPEAPPPQAAVDVAPAGESAFLAAAPPVLVVYASVTGTSRGYALRLRDALARAGVILDRYYVKRCAYREGVRAVVKKALAHADATVYSLNGV